MKMILWDFFTVEQPIKHFNRTPMTMENAKKYCEKFQLRKVKVKIKK